MKLECSMIYQSTTFFGLGTPWTWSWCSILKANNTTLLLPFLKAPPFPSSAFLYIWLGNQFFRCCLGCWCYMTFWILEGIWMLGLLCCCYMVLLLTKTGLEFIYSYNQSLASFLANNALYCIPSNSIFQYFIVVVLYRVRTIKFIWMPFKF